RNKFAFFVRNTSENQREQFITFLNNQEQTLVLNNQVNIDGQEKYFQTTCRKYYNNYAELIKVLGVTIDITELQDNKKQVNAGLQDEAVIAKITTLLNTTVEFETSINQVIELIGNHLKVDRIAIYYFNKKKNKCASFTWGFTEGLNNDSSKITLADLQLINQRVIYEDFSALPAAARKILTGAEHYKMCLCPLLIGEEQIGYVTFQQAKEKPWYNIKSEWIETIVNLISRAFEREEHHQEIKRQQNLLRNITNSLTDVITQTDIEGNIIYASPGWKDVTGFHPHEIIGKSAFNFIHPDDLPVVIAKFKSLAKSGTDSAQFRFLNKSGKFVWCETRSSLVLKKDNQIEGIITGGYVIEERVKVEMALRNNEQKYRTLFEKAPIGVLLVDSDGNIQEINHVLMQTFNLSSRDLQVSNVFHKSWLKKSPIFANIQHCTKNNQPVTGEEKFIHENNKVIIFKYYLNPLLIDDEITQVQAILIDITNQKQVEDALKKNQIKLQQITNNITDLITEVDMNGKIIYASPAWEFLLGYKPAEIINQSISKVLINSSASTLLNQIKRKAANKRKKTYQHQMKSKSGKIFWFESSGQTLTDDKNNKTGIVFGSSDITERKLAEQKLINQNEALKKANEELDSFVYRSSHDLKAPLTSVLGLINISKYSEEIPERNNFLLLMEQTITKLEKVIKQITDYSRNARLELTIEKIDFQKTWESLLDELSFLDKFDKIKFEFQLKQPTDFYSDRDRIFGIIKNILSNAIIYRSWNDKVNWINCTIEVAETQAIITIIDNGTGIVKEQQDKIFNMFHRSSNISKGAGLGLYIVKEMLQRLEGSIEFTSEPGKGSSFKVVVPNLKK
ncbi:MAG: PAS domain S-box protein, partial [Cyclobacteriaceae bacterium]